MPRVSGRRTTSLISTSKPRLVIGAGIGLLVICATTVFKAQIASRRATASRIAFGIQTSASILHRLLRAFRFARPVESGRLANEHFERRLVNLFSFVNVD